MVPIFAQSFSRFSGFGGSLPFLGGFPLSVHEKAFPFPSGWWQKLIPLKNLAREIRSRRNRFTEPFAQDTQS